MEKKVHIALWTFLVPKAAIKITAVKIQYFLRFPEIFAIFDAFSKFCSTFGTLHFEKSSNIAKILWQNGQNLSIIILLKNGRIWNQKYSPCTCDLIFPKYSKNIQYVIIFTKNIFNYRCTCWPWQQGELFGCHRRRNGSVYWILG